MSPETSSHTSIDDKMTTPGGVFVSYSKVDFNRVKIIVDYLAGLGLTIWWDRKLEPGSIYRYAIQTALNEVACVVVFWTNDSIKSTFVFDEIQNAGRNGLLVTVMLDSLDPEKDIPIGFRQHHNLDLSQWNYQDTTALQALVNRIEWLVKRGPNNTRFNYNLQTDEWTVDNSKRIVTDMRSLTQKVRTISDILSNDLNAAKELRIILGEVGKTYEAVSSAIKRFVSPAFGTGAIEPEPYLALERTDLKSQVNKGRGSCGLIMDRYLSYNGLRDFIVDKNDPDLLKNADEVLGRLADADGDMFRPLEEIGDLLRNESRVIVNLLASGQEKLARQRILDGRNKINGLEDQLADALQELQEVQSSLGYVQLT